jgi:UDP-glucuronate decarboxylase
MKVKLQWCGSSDALSPPSGVFLWGLGVGKRIAETTCMSYAREGFVDVRIARIFNTFGPRMHPEDGRVVSNFIKQSLMDEPLTVYGSGDNTRSFQYVSDLVRGLIALMASEYKQPVNIGNPEEYTVLQFAQKIKDKVWHTCALLASRSPLVVAT